MIDPPQGPDGPLRFADDYSEELTLADGARLGLRQIRPGDKEAVLEGFDQLSFNSRRFRFLSPKPRLSPTELRYLTEVDGWSHFALVAAILPPDGPGEPVAVGRFVRLPDRPDTAEMAVTVVDEHQRRGIGTLLIRRLAAAAAERRVEWFVAEGLVENKAMEALVRKLTPNAERTIAGAAVTYRFRVAAE